MPFTPRPAIVVTIEGGLVQNIEQIPLGIIIEIHDYDTDGADEDALQTDSEGKKFALITYGVDPRPPTMVYWGVTEAFDKFGFGDGDGIQFNDIVIEALEKRGFRCAQAGGIHNKWIIEARHADFALIEFDGYRLPPWDSLPDLFKQAILEVAPAFIPDQWRLNS